MDISGQVTVNGKVPGELWRTTNVSGEVEVMHIAGRTAVMPVKDAWVNIDGDRISIGARCDNPILDGQTRKNYWMPSMRGTLSKEFPQAIQTIVDTAITGYGDNEEFRTIKTAMIVMESGKPKSLVFTVTEYADFDLPKFLKMLKGRDTAMAKREIEQLQGFDALGFRQRTFRAVFR